MILLFLGSWRSTLIVCISIPLSILTSLCILSLLGQTINVMTLGGLALAVGILVDDATVEIENTHRNMAMRKPLVTRRARWRVADRRSDLCRHAFDLHRVRAGAAADRNGAVSVHAAGHGGGLRHAGFLSACRARWSRPWWLIFCKSEVDLYQQGRHGETAGGRACFWRVHHVFNGLFERSASATSACSIGRCGIAGAS